MATIPYRASATGARPPALAEYKMLFMRIAHLSDPHINLKYHPQHLPRLRRTLEDALRRGAEHIVITGDLTSNADARDLRTTRRLFEMLGIMRSSKLTIVPGNHDIYGGPQLADDVLAFPERCRICDTRERLAIFQEHFSELFADTITVGGLAYPFVKRLKHVAFMALNTVAEHSVIGNPFGSNGEIVKGHRQSIDHLGNFHAWRTARYRIVLMHHHLFRHRDLVRMGRQASSGLASTIELQTLKLHRKRRALGMFERIGANLLLHGHVHFTGQYDRNGLICLNSAGAVSPTNREDGFAYHLIDLGVRAPSISRVTVSKLKRESIIESPQDNARVIATV
ncbi:MAG: metallophosphoesterase [Bacteroidota bacterium]|nr:metallophosphoesterase [Bacteroidota bacterium]MDP4234108.1 metallophosphoesterase [Bacteroidota bacterium]MDP4243049.1 metallophosphoesterase [Bacteroidota bacterium]MDP4287475.1 metallophosphoesterase [Bacteroidota bacterium]